MLLRSLINIFSRTRNEANNLHSVWDSWKLLIYLVRAGLLTFILLWLEQLWVRFRPFLIFWLIGFSFQQISHFSFFRRLFKRLMTPEKKYFCKWLTIFLLLIVVSNCLRLIYGWCKWLMTVRSYWSFRMILKKFFTWVMVQHDFLLSKQVKVDRYFKVVCNMQFGSVTWFVYTSSHRIDYRLIEKLTPFRRWNC